MRPYAYKSRMYLNGYGVKTGTKYLIIEDIERSKVERYELTEELKIALTILEQDVNRWNDCMKICTVFDLVSNIKQRCPNDLLLSTFDDEDITHAKRELADYYEKKGR